MRRTASSIAGSTAFRVPAVSESVCATASHTPWGDIAAENALGLTLPQRAYQVVSNLFEEIISDPYWQAYHALSVGEQVALLNVAALNKDSTFNHDWIFGELVKLGDSSSNGVFAERCCSAPRKGGFMLGQNTKLFLLSILGLSRTGCRLPDWRDEERSPEIAWKAIRGLLYNEWAGAGEQNEVLWTYLMTEDPLGGVSVILQIYYELFHQDRLFGTKLNPEVAWGLYLKRLMEIGLKNWERVDPGDLRPGSSDPFGILVGIVEKIGDEQTVALLEPYTSDEEKGRTAIEGIRKIKQRMRRPI
jgi:hypothetical protein